MSVLKLKTLFFFLILTCCSFNLFGQTSNWLWAKSSTASNAWAVPNSTCTDAAGNVYVTGYFYSHIMTFGSFTLVNPDTAGNYCDLFIVKYDSNGNVLWAKSAGGNYQDYGTSIAVDASGNVFITGGFFSYTLVFGSIVIHNSNSNGIRTDFFIAKFDANGNALWAKSYGGPNDDASFSISVDPIGNAFITGRFHSATLTFGSTTLINNGYSNLFLAKFDPNGNELWARSAGGTNQVYPNSVNADASGSVVITGSYYDSTITFGAITLSGAASTASGDIYIVKYDANGNVLWAKTAVGIEEDKIYSSSIDAIGNTYITGYFTYPGITFDTITLNASVYHDLFIAKYDTNGNLLWAKDSEGSEDAFGYSIRADVSGNVFVSGRYWGNTFVFDGDSLLPILSDNPKFIIKLDGNGNLLCSSILKGETAGIRALSTDLDGNAYVVGNFWGSSLTLGSNTLQLSGSSGDVFVAKFKSNCTIQAASPAPFIETFNIIFPNPFSTTITIQFATIPTNAEVNIYDLAGQEIISIKNISNNNTAIDLSNVANGIYFVKVISGADLFTQKIIKE